eukprot:2622987-Karenia_brevis.AAC.1
MCWPGVCAHNMIAALSFGFRNKATITAAELESCVWGAAYFASWLESPERADENVRSWQILDTKRFDSIEKAASLVWSREAGCRYLE